jgi:UDP-N-acetylglucosamine/UDP-N-acetylgalactosamine diphosphorylase
LVGSGIPQVTSYEQLRAHFEAHGQGHVFRFWDRLSAAEREGLLAQAASIDLPRVLAAVAAAHGAPELASPKLSPTPVERIPEHGGDPARFEAARKRGEALLASGRVALLVVAGGQATRLGYPGPKGTYPIGPVTQRSLFEIQAQKLRGLRRRYEQPLPWYVMTSPATDAPTRDFFARHRHFGLPPDDVFFFRQSVVPSFDLDDRLVLCEPGRLMENPDGHGGCLTALLRSGGLDDMARRGVSTFFYYQVDNPLVRMADPAYLGFHAESDAEVSCKVVAKQEPMEKMGVLARTERGVGVVEYTEIDDEQRCLRDEDGRLVYWAGNMAIHVFETDFVRRVAGDADRWLPFHASEKKLPTVDDEGRPQEPAAPNGRKLERFVFDALPAAERVCVVETARQEEYAPVKNASGPDSPETTRSALVRQYRSWLEAAGLEVPQGARIELDHSQIDSAEDARRLGIRNLSEASDIVRIASGAEA